MSELLYAHVTVNLTVNESESSWREPRASSYVSFEIPLVLFDGAKLAKLVEGRLKELVEELPDRKAEYELKQAQEAEEKAKGEGA